MGGLCQESGLGMFAYDTDKISVILFVIVRIHIYGIITTYIQEVSYPQGIRVRLRDWRISRLLTGKRII